ncbi:hypothetical protein QZM82_35215 [Burkholderia cepacia]|uniref:hypothetical protein n=1 Tax=Burkholderia cepacia TaxID=292 RepID=UPI0026541A95|nr:hypothetical protein [Burkholderia cepacia]MDN7901453.1 hypothetical protein [Burkholderia cepacia]
MPGLAGQSPNYRGVKIVTGHLRADGLHAGSFLPLLRALFTAAKVSAPDSYSTLAAPQLRKLSQQL